MERLTDFDILEVNGSIGIALPDDDRFIRLASTETLKQRIDDDLAERIP